MGSLKKILLSRGKKISIFLLTTTELVLAISLSELMEFFANFFPVIPSFTIPGLPYDAGVYQIFIFIATLTVVAIVANFFLVNLGVALSFLREISYIFIVISLGLLLDRGWLAWVLWGLVVYLTIKFFDFWETTALVVRGLEISLIALVASLAAAGAVKLQSYIKA